MNEAGKRSLSLSDKVQYLPGVGPRRAASLGRLGIETVGIGAPGHFLARVTVDGQEQLMDPFTGGTPISNEEAFQRIETAHTLGSLVCRSCWYTLLDDFCVHLLTTSIDYNL